MHETHSCLETMEKMERWIQEHRGDPRGSRLVRVCPMTDPHAVLICVVPGVGWLVRHDRHPSFVSCYARQPCPLQLPQRETAQSITHEDADAWLGMSEVEALKF